MNLQIILFYIILGWRLWPPDPLGKHRKSLNHGSSSSAGNFPVDSCQPFVLFGRTRPKIIGKSPKNFRREYWFHVPSISGVFSPERPGTSWPGYLSEIHELQSELWSPERKNHDFLKIYHLLSIKISFTIKCDFIVYDV